MVGHLCDHFVFSSRRLTRNAKAAFFALFAGGVIFVFWWFKGVSFGIEGPIEEHWGLQWRKSWNVSRKLLLSSLSSRGLFPFEKAVAAVRREDES